MMNKIYCKVYGSKTDYSILSLGSIQDLTLNNDTTKRPNKDDPPVEQTSSLTRALDYSLLQVRPIVSFRNASEILENSLMLSAIRKDIESWIYIIFIVLLSIMFVSTLCGLRSSLKLTKV